MLDRQHFQANDEVFVACITFLYLNGWHVQAPDDEKIALMLDVATDARSEADIAAWLEGRAVARV